MPTMVSMELNMIDRLRIGVVADHLIDMDLADLGRLRRALIAALDEVEVALGPAIVRGAEGGMTYVELAAAGGYGSVTTIVKIMKDAGASPGSGRHPRNRSRVRR